MSNVINLTDAKEGVVVTAKKEGKFWNFYCACGSDMWNNMSKKNKGELGEKMPDLRCKDDNCENKKGGYPYGMWLTEDQKEELGLKSSSKSGNTTNKTTFSKSNTSKVNYNDFSQGIPVSMYSAWAKDIALYLAKSKEIKDTNELMNLYGECLAGTKKELDNFIMCISNPEAKEVEDLFSDDEDIIEEEKPVTKPKSATKTKKVEEVEDVIDVDDDDINFDDLEDINF